jgi:hypothetical protein
LGWRVGAVADACGRAGLSRLSARQLALVALVAAVALAGGVRLVLAAVAEHPGHGDYAFYYTVAENLATGRGLVVDYIWTYLGSPEAITGPSHDYWMPLASVVMAGSFLLFGPSMLAALVPSILAGLAVGLLTYAFGFGYARSRFVAGGAAAVVLVLPALFRYSLLTDAAIYYAVLVMACLVCLQRGRSDRRFLLAAAGLAGLAHLARQDGVLLLVVVLASVLADRRRPLPERVELGAHAAAIYLAVLAPLLLVNLHAFGTPLPPGPGRTAFLTHYEDLYAYARAPGPAGFFAWGIENIVRSRGHMALSNALTVHRLLGDLLAGFMVVGLVGIVHGRDRRRAARLAAPLALLGLLFAFYTLVATFPSAAGGFKRSAMALAPVLVVVAVDALARAVRDRRLAVLCVGLVCAMALGKSVLTTRLTLAEHARLGGELERLGTLIAADAAARGDVGDDIVVMTRNPWEVYHSTRYRAVQIPHDDRETILGVARRFGADYLVLPAPRPALAAVYRGEEVDPRLELVGRVPDSERKVFRLRVGPAVAGAPVEISEGGER